MLQRNVETNRNLYNTLLSKLKETNINSNVDMSNIRITEKATTPRSPITLDSTRRVIKNILLGLVIGIALAFGREYLDQTLRTEEDVQRYLNLPVLSVIPKSEKQ
jgi:succinoglycan biosynthesis transport protein ExoP